MLPRKPKSGAFVLVGTLRSAGRGWCCCLLLLAGLSELRAWSSKDFPLFEPVHQEAVQRVLGGELNAEQLALVCQEQVNVDREQKAYQSFEHAMTGVEKGHDEATERPRYILASEGFVHAHLSAAIVARKAGDLPTAFMQFGKALHALEDGSSPAHEPFQAWHDNESVWDIARHVSKERSYPDGERRARLEGTVRWAYELFLEKVPMPERFYSTEGLLQVPKAYVEAVKP